MKYKAFTQKLGKTLKLLKQAEADHIREFLMAEISVGNTKITPVEVHMHSPEEIRAILKTVVALKEAELGVELNVTAFAAVQ